MRTYIVDTHTLIWYLDNDRRLGKHAEAILDDPQIRIIIPAIVLAEVKYLAHRGRFAQTLDDVLRVLSIDPRCIIYPVDLSVVKAAPVGLSIHDSLIIGTALVQREIIDGLLTQDEAIVASGLVSTVW